MIFFLLKLILFSENIFKLSFIIFLDLKKGPAKENKKENIFLLILIPTIRPKL